MAGKTSVPDDKSLLSRLDRGLYRFERALALLSGLAVLSLMVLAVLSVGGRNFFNQPLPGYVDWIEQAMPLIAFMGIAYVMRDGGHIRMDMLIGQLRGRALYAVELLSTLLILTLMVCLVWGSWAHFGRSFDFSMPLWSRDSSMDIALPLWPAKLLVPVAFSVLCGRLVLQVWAWGRALIEDAERPIAVPMVEDPATQAKREAEHVSGHDT